MDEKAADTELRSGATALADRKAAVINTWALFDQAVAGQKKNRIEALGTTFLNSKEERATLTNAWLGNNDSGWRNLWTRKLQPSLRVIHGAHAYWSVALEARRMGRAKTDEEAEAIIVSEREVFAAVVAHAESLRQLAPSISELGVGKSDLIRFVMT
jgi:hypothetical protein